MGNRVSISFKNKEDKKESITFFSHWGGMTIVEKAEEYIKKLKKESKEKNNFGPLYRFEPRTIIVDFIRYITKDEERIFGDYYLGKDESEGDNSDNGHHIIEVGKEYKK